MKQLIFFCTLLISFSITNAQYKKASFFTRNGKLYGIMAGINIYGHGVSATPTAAFVWGKDQGKNRIWHWFEIKIKGPSKYSYTTTNTSGTSTQVNVNGTTDPEGYFTYNWAFYLVDNKNEENKILPFVKIGIGAPFVGGIVKTETVSPTSATPAKTTNSIGGNGGVDFCLGTTYKLSEKTTLFGLLGYSLQLRESNTFSSRFQTVPSHPLLNIGIRFSKHNDN